MSILNDGRWPRQCRVRIGECEQIIAQPAQGERTFAWMRPTQNSSLFADDSDVEAMNPGRINGRLFFRISPE